MQFLNRQQCPPGRTIQDQQQHIQDMAVNVCVLIIFY